MKKISLKILISIISFISILLMANSSFAVVTVFESKPDTVITLQSGGHTDEWTGLWELLPKGITTDTAVGVTFCRQKHQALRFTPNEAIALYGYKTSTIVAHSELHSYGPGNVPATYARANAISNVKNELQSKLTDVGWGAVEVGTGNLAEYGIGSYRYTAIQEGDNIVATSDAYSKTPVYVGQGAEAVQKNDVAYILTSGAFFNPITAFGLKQGNYAGTVSDRASGESNALLIQDAIWASSYNEAASDGINYRRVKPQIALDLVAEAEAYARYVSKLDNYKATFLDTKPKAIAKVSEGKYSVGPLKIDYPDDTRFSYIQDIYLVDGSGNKIDTKYFKIVTASGKAYPSSNENFFLEFDRSVGDKYTRINVKAEFAYLSLTYAEIERYIGTGEIAQIVGILESSTGRHVYDTKPYPAVIENGIIIKDAGVEDLYCDTTSYTGRFEERVIGAYDPQDLFDVLQVKRAWVEDYTTTYADRPTPPTPPTPPTGNPPPPPGKDIDLTTSLGGYVWVDTENGKEGILNGIYDNGEDRVPNIIVNLYEQGGKYLKQTKTDANGEYRFYDLNPMNKYYVEFIYNGMYYEPTYYTSPTDNKNGWGKGTWQNNSNATELIETRDVLNSRFAYIGSSPENYEYGEGKVGKRTYTKQELINAGVIDKFGNLINGNSEMTTFVLDSQIAAHTGNNTSYDSYVIPDVYVIDNEARVKNAYGSMYNMREEANKVAIIFPDAYYINLGLHPRQEVDLAVKKDIQKVDIEINGHKHTYTYDTLENKPDADGTWEIGVRLSDAYYSTTYSRELYKSDYLYKASNYGDRALELGKTKEDELNVYVTYKLMVRNQSSSIKTSVEELVDFYDTDYTLDYDGDGVLDTSRSYIQIGKGENAGKYPIKLSTESKYSPNTRNNIDGYNRVYISGLEGKYLDKGQMAYFYVTFKVGKQKIDNEDWLYLDEDITTGIIGNGKENIVELNGYSTKYIDGVTVPNREKVSEYAGIIDRDSNPGNAYSSDVKTFEDDTDKAPNMKLILYRDDDGNRVIVGSAWEDIRDKEVGLATVGNGEYEENKDVLINGVKVELVELMNNGTEFVWRETVTGPDTKVSPIINGNINGENIIKDYSFGENTNLDGLYVFKSFVPGKYVVRFTYGDSEKTVITKALAELNGMDSSKYNVKSYNGQDYKTTTYQKGIAQNKAYDWRERSTWDNGTEVLGNVLTTVTTYDENATKNEPVVNVAEKKLQGEKGYLYDITASAVNPNASDAKDIESRRNVVNDYSDNNVTNYIAEVLASHKAEYETMNDRNALLKDLMQNTAMTAETGLIVAEIEYDRTSTENQENENKTAYKIENVSLGLEERPKAQIAINKNVKNVKLTLADNSILFDAQGPEKNVLWKPHKDYEISYNKNLIDITPLGEIRADRAFKAGLVQLTMDEELMHGATIKVDYDITITNVGEVDYKDNRFYYMGIEAEADKIVKTTPNKVLDYVSNNINFNASENKAWEVISLEEIKKQGLVNEKLIKDGENDGVVTNYNTIIVAKLENELEPKIFSDNNSVTIPLTLTELLTSENNSEDLTYRNIVEIAETSNTVGRRNEYSVVGNQNPEELPQELDSDLAEVIRILPPFGNAGIYIIISIVAIIAIVIIATGIIFIKKKVLTK